MKITDLRTRIVHLDFRNCVLVTIETDAGITGISETVMKRKTFTIEQSILQLGRYLVGKDPRQRVFRQGHLPEPGPDGLYRGTVPGRRRLIPRPSGHISEVTL